MGARAISPQEIQADLISNFLRKTPSFIGGVFLCPVLGFWLGHGLHGLFLTQRRQRRSGPQRKNEHDASCFFSLRISTFLVRYSHCPVLGFLSGHGFSRIYRFIFTQIICVHLRTILDCRVVPFTSRSFFWFSCYWALRPLMCFANFTGAPPWRLTTGRSRHSSAGISVARSITKHESPNVRGTFVSIACILADIRIRLRAGFQVRGSPHPH